MFCTTKRVRVIILLMLIVGLLLMGWLAVDIPSAAAAVLYASPGGAISGACDISWTNACELRYALQIAATDDEIWIEAGTYTPTVEADRTATFQLKDGVALYGGFAGDEIFRTKRNWQDNPTILSGDLNGDDSGFTNNGENSYHVVTGATGATLDGVTISGGNATITGSFDGYGGGMYNNNSSPTLTNVTFSGNSVIHYGGGMFNRETSSPTLTNVTFSGNSATTLGGGLYNSNSSSPTIRNSILWDNSAPQIRNLDSTSTVSNSVVQDGCPTGSTCTNLITTDPLLGALGNYGGDTATIPLLPGSSAINVGDSDYCPDTDQRGKSRVSTCDIGTFESQGFTFGSLTGTPQSAVINTEFAAPLGLTVTANDMVEPVNGGKVTFTPPGSGASATITTSPATIADGAVSVTATANGTAGSYTVTASASGASDVDFALTNRGIPIIDPGDSVSVTMSEDGSPTPGRRRPLRPPTRKAIP